MGASAAKRLVVKKSSTKIDILNIKFLKNNV